MLHRDNFRDAGQSSELSDTCASTRQSHSGDSRSKAMSSSKNDDADADEQSSKESDVSLSKKILEVSRVWSDHGNSQSISHW